MARTILLTGASGTLGRLLVQRLGARGYSLLLSDIVPFPDPLPAGAAFEQADLADEVAIRRLVRGSEAVLHFGGINGEQPYRRVFDANIHGVTNLFEAAREKLQRVVFASSNHITGYYERGKTLDATDPVRPDGYYGLSKAYAELLGRLMFDKHGLESVHLRIGSCLPVPTEARHLSTWLSYDDLERLVVASLDAPETGHATVWGVSANAASWWNGDDAARIGYAPQDDASRFAPLPETGDTVTRRFQGGSFAAMDYTRGSEAP